jgi:hypothetical protein
MHMAASKSKRCTRVLESDGCLNIEVRDGRLLKAKHAATTNDVRGKKTQSAHGSQTSHVLVRTPQPPTKCGKGKRPWSSIRLEPDAVFEEFKTGCGLRSSTSAQKYIGNLRTLRQMCGGVPVQSILLNPQPCLKMIQGHASKHGLSCWSVVNYINSLLAACKHVIPCSVKAKVKQHIDVWQAAHKQLQLKANQGMITNKASNKQQAGFVSYQDLVCVRDNLPAASIERLLLCMLTMIPPPRADLGECRLFVGRAPTAQQLFEYKGNYMVLLPSAESSYIHYRVFKTARSFPGGVKVSLPLVLLQELHLSLKEHPRSYLFEQQRHPGKPYTRSAFSGWACKTLQRCTQNPDVNLQLVRHAYVTRAMDLNRLKDLRHGDVAGRILLEKRLQGIARAMMHSQCMQQRYWFCLKADGAPERVNTRKVVQPRRATVEPTQVEMLPW